MGAMASRITILAIVCSTIYSGTDQRKHQSSASLAFVRGIHIHRWPLKSQHKWPVTRKMFPFDDVIMRSCKVSTGQRSRESRVAKPPSILQYKMNVLRPELADARLCEILWSFPKLQLIVTFTCGSGDGPYNGWRCRQKQRQDWSRHRQYLSSQRGARWQHTLEVALK